MSKVSFNSNEGFVGGAIAPIKEKLGDSISFGEIRIAIASSTFKKQSVI